MPEGSPPTLHEVSSPGSKYPSADLGPVPYDHQSRHPAREALTSIGTTCLLAYGTRALARKVFGEGTRGHD